MSVFGLYCILKYIENINLGLRIKCYRLWFRLQVSVLASFSMYKYVCTYVVNVSMIEFYKDFSIVKHNSVNMWWGLDKEYI